MRVAPIARLLLAILALAGCGDPPAAAPDGVALASFCERWVAATCARVAACGCAAVSPELAMSCEPAASTFCPLAEGQDLRAAVDDGTVAYDEAAAARWIARIEAAACGPGPACDATGECIGVSGRGGPCGTSHVCDEGLGCVDGTCVTPVRNGMPCAEAAACLSERCEAGVCEPKAGDGEPCSDDEACQSTHCSAATERCDAPEAEGALCTEHTDCASGYCDRDLELGAGNCGVVVAVGEPCEDSEGCAGGACVRAICASQACVP